MKVIGLNESCLKAVSLYSEMHDSDSCDLVILICNNYHGSVVKFLAIQALQFLKMPWKDKWSLVKLTCEKKVKISLSHVYSKNILTWIEKKSPDVGLHGMNIIYKKPLISLFRLGIINPHIGILPEYRGRSVMEWSILCGDPTGITTFFIDEGIDTGEKIITLDKISVSEYKDILSAKKFLFSMDTEMFKKAIRLLSQGDQTYIENDISKGKRFYVMSKLFSNAVEEILQHHYN
jgi:folate-dependent phosphoribosylglycinamide formyltransferase PurN